MIPIIHEHSYTIEVNSLRIAWSSAALRQACVSRDGLAQVASSHAGAARMLLALVSAADDLAQLATLNSVDVSRGDTEVLLRLSEVELEGQLVPASARQRHGTIAQIETRTGLLIRAVRIAGHPLLKAAG